MNDGRNKFGFALRDHERRLRLIEDRLGLPRSRNPLNDPRDHSRSTNDQDRPTTAVTETITHEPSFNR
jgi:hypothetical protein